MIHEVEVREEEILKYNAELEESQNELRSSNDEIFATLQQLMAIERELNQQNIYLDEQNIKLSNFIDGLNAGTWEWDITTGIILINERWGEMIGFQMDEIYPLTSEKFFECVHPEDLKRLNEDLKDTMDGKTLYFETKFRLRHKYMDWVWVHSIAKVIKRDKSQLPLLMSGIHIDISDSVANELKIEERLKETKLIADFTSSILTENSETI